MGRGWSRVGGTLGKCRISLVSRGMGSLLPAPFVPYHGGARLPKQTAEKGGRRLLKSLLSSLASRKASCSQFLFNSMLLSGCNNKEFMKEKARIFPFLCKGFMRHSSFRLPQQAHCFRDMGMEQPVARTKSLVLGKPRIAGSGGCTFVGRSGSTLPSHQPSGQPRLSPEPPAGGCGLGPELDQRCPPSLQAGSQVSRMQSDVKSPRRAHCSGKVCKQVTRAP